MNVRIVVSCPPCVVPVETKTPAGFPSNIFCIHSGPS